MPIPLLPPWPNRNERPEPFNDKVNAFLPALNPWAAAVDAVAALVQGAWDDVKVKAAAITQALSDMITLRNQAQEFALTAVNAPGTKATSTTSLTLATGLLALKIQTGKAFAGGQPAVIASAADRSKRGLGYIDSYDPPTGDLVIRVNSLPGGAATAANWIIALAPDSGMGPASKEDLWGGTNNDRAPTALTLAEARKLRAVAPAAGVIAWDVTQVGYKIKVQLGSGSHTLSLPSGLREGDVLTFVPVQPPSGGAGSVVYPAAFKFGAAGTPTHSAANSAWDVCRGEVLSVSPYVIDATFKKIGAV